MCNIRKGNFDTRFFRCASDRTDTIIVAFIHGTGFGSRPPADLEIDRAGVEFAREDVNAYALKLSFIVISQ